MTKSKTPFIPMTFFCLLMVISNTVNAQFRKHVAECYCKPLLMTVISTPSWKPLLSRQMTYAVSLRLTDPSAFRIQSSMSYNTRITQQPVSFKPHSLATAIQFYNQKKEPLDLSSFIYMGYSLFSHQPSMIQQNNNH